MGEAHRSCTLMYSMSSRYGSSVFFCSRSAALIWRSTDAMRYRTERPPRPPLFLYLRPLVLLPALHLLPSPRPSSSRVLGSLLPLLRLGLRAVRRSSSFRRHLVGGPLPLDTREPLSLARSRRLGPLTQPRGPFAAHGGRHRRPSVGIRRPLLHPTAFCPRKDVPASVSLLQLGYFSIHILSTIDFHTDSNNYTLKLE